MFRVSIFSILFLFNCIASIAQPNFNRQDSLRGSITPERIWWDLQHYDLHVNVDVEEKKLSGHNVISYKVLEPYTPQRMQIDLQEPMNVVKVIQNKKEVSFSREGNVYWIDLEMDQIQGNRYQIEVHYEGQPVVSKNPPWQGGLTWTLDKNNIDWIVTTCQGAGASLWWPCKDHMYDEPDSMGIHVTVPEHLMDVSNGRLASVENHNNGTKTYHWSVVNPINNYGVNLNIGNYVHFSEVYQGLNGPLDCDYYVLPYNLEKAKTHFKEVPRMLEAFEYWFGPYPFYEDGFKLVDVPYPGMEHQSSVTYGNFYKNGYRGRDVSGTGWGFKFDFIIIHEAGHEWFANNITNIDIADMWIHEGFTSYSENLFLDYHFGKKASSEYVIGTRKNIRNDRPLIGYYDVNHEGSTDMYYKGANVLHTLRQIVNDDEKWRSILIEMNKVFYHQTVSSEEIEQFLSKKTGLDLLPFFNQYLRDKRLPIFEFYRKKEKLYYRFNNCIEEFRMPLRIKENGVEKWIQPTTSWQKLELKEGTAFEVDDNFYISTSIIKRD